MTTSTQYIKNLKQKIITSKMLEDALYSCNKRAKNCRDKQEEYRRWRLSCRYERTYYNDKYDNEGKYREKKEHYYNMKSCFLRLLEPCAIHVHELENGEKRYMLFYELENHSFHSPISFEDAKKRTDLPIKTLDASFYTFGRDIQELLSVQFTEKMYDLILSGDYTLVA
ncbi:hypothetical protein [Eubacterium sp. MSJ-33]|uniref:hypothetical protein n=1 Tax=Eubacterium sp. MSJ-33 TaxID=2841528 RepID=UPI001C73E91F|nr:hypothetical protein [Eubacterium sp. MSJ-33]QWT54240.1 hypothetical protein KP625_06520 [Eubacterium sp. MSJ-33]